MPPSMLLITLAIKIPVRLFVSDALAGDFSGFVAIIILVLGLVVALVAATEEARVRKRKSRKVCG